MTGRAAWRASKLKYEAGITLGKMLQTVSRGPSDELRPYVRAASVGQNGRLAIDGHKQMWFSEDERRELALVSGDILVVEGGDAGRSVLLKENVPDWGFQNSVNRIRTEPRNDARFIHYWLSHARSSGYLRAQCDVVSIPHLTAEKLKRLRLSLPMRADQSAIADYLDRETAQIDTLIAKQEQLIATLGERRIAVEALTFDQFPWVTPLHAVSTLIQTGPFGSQLKSDEYVAGGTPLINPSHLVDGRIAADPNVAINEAKARELSRHAFELGDVVVARRGELARSAVVPEAHAGYLCGTGSALIRPRADALNGRYLAAVYRTRRNRDALSLASVGSTMESVNSDIIGSLRIPVPSLNRQAATLVELDRQMISIDTLIAKAERFIELSKERRAALITAAVTGQFEIPS